MKEILLILIGAVGGSLATVSIERWVGGRDASKAEARKVVLVARTRELMRGVLFDDSSPPVAYDDAEITNHSQSPLRHVTIIVTNDDGQTETGTIDPINPGCDHNVPMSSANRNPKATATFTIDDTKWHLTSDGTLKRWRATT